MTVVQRVWLSAVLAVGSFKGRYVEGRIQDVARRVLRDTAHRMATTISAPRSVGPYNSRGRSSVKLWRALGTAPRRTIVNQRSLLLNQRGSTEGWDGLCP
jgi:hypothetical protein